ncbi:uncharacterized protein MYCFIDRAFT_205551 [Pseudocercospora fijiensis CIRAD86]|uniref:Cyclin-D1-binding protein 1-like N-terminal domain-containing protein n=1 Tax=Pseudocercospora fijiensis (strain CIRAD86) TaxID=383855 RepID=M3AI68_PSEFD|nr:uncharacterized protein MYCFIDRAFT_205551 [Pseudocercospora fijiensis CIRAD86]EME76903.1 hypothetical protein MYCFIDRAFT_205551 [Pseudocercospora fijiensis CIRAD86]
MAPSQADLKTLQDLISTTQSLLKQFSATLTTTETKIDPIENPPNPLDVLRDSAKLLKAHTTKISLLAINKPFTPTAITKVLRDLSSTCLPAMLSASQICTLQEKSIWGTTISHELRIRIKRVFLEIQNLLTELHSISNGNDAGSSTARDSLSSTGVVWDSCDALIALSHMGIAGLAVQKAEQYRDTIKDAIAELQEWKEGTDLDAEGHDGDELLGSDDEGVDGEEVDSLDEIFNAANSMPKDRPELKELVEVAEGRLKKVVFLYTALGKRRFKEYRVEMGKVEVVDRVLMGLSVVQNGVDELISKFYDLDEDGAKEELEKCVREAKDAAALVRLDWSGKEDEFTAWSKKWEEALE